MGIIYQIAFILKLHMHLVPEISSMDRFGCHTCELVMYNSSEQSCAACSLAHLKEDIGATLITAKELECIEKGNKGA